MRLHLLKHYMAMSYDVLDSYLYDIARYLRHSQMIGKFRSRSTAKAHLLLSIHALEKGLALPEPRPAYGKEKCSVLLGDLSKFYGKFSADPILKYGCEVIEEVIGHHKKNDVEDIAISRAFNDLKNKLGEIEPELTRKGGLIISGKQNILDLAPPDPFEFFNSRHSVREFDQRPIAEELLLMAFRMAQLSPSVCNRQTGRVHYTTDREKMKMILDCQRGNTGFGHEAGAVIIVTSELSSFNKPGERNQQYVDGGLFAMTLALSLHSLGMGTCFLNWSTTGREDRKLRKIGIIPDSEAVITLLVAGHLKEQFKVAASPRLPLFDIIQKH